MRSINGIFVAGGFAEVTGERCTVLAEEAVPVDDIDASATEARIAAAKEAIAEADNDTARAGRRDRTRGRRGDADRGRRFLTENAPAASGNGRRIA